MFSLLSYKIIRGKTENDHHKIYDFILKHFPFFWETWAEDKSRALANNKGEIEDSLNLFVPNAPFSSSWKLDFSPETLQFSDVFRGREKVHCEQMGWNFTLMQILSNFY